MNTPMIDRFLREETFSREQADALRDELSALKRTPTPPRRLREYVSNFEGVTRTYRVRDGVLEVSGDGGAWVKAWTIYTGDASAIADLLANPDEPQPVETLEDVIEAWWWEPEGTPTEDSLSDLCTRIRAYLAQQPQAITPEQAVNVLVEHGGTVAENVVHVETKRGGFMYRDAAPARVVILSRKEATP